MLTAKRRGRDSNVKYYETPFDAPMVEQDAIYHYAQGAEQTQKNVQFSYQILAVKENFGIAQWQANFVRISSGNHVKLDGILLAKFDDQIKCNDFREWWHRQEINVSPSDT